MLSSLSLKSQTYYGIGINLNYYRLTNISQDTIVPYGYSGALIKQSTHIQFNPHINIKRVFSKRNSLQVGVGYLPINHRLSINFYNSFFQRQVDTNLTIKLTYIGFQTRYSRTIMSKGKLTLSLGVSAFPRFLLNHRDNYDDIILETIAFVKPNWFSNFSLSTLGSFTLSKLIKTNSHVDVNLNLQRDVLPFITRKPWGLYQNFLPSRNIYFGIGINYYSSFKK